MPTATTIPLIILVSLLWRYTRGQILPIVLFTSIFDAASALTFGNLGLSPWLFALVICLLVKLLQGHRPFRITSGSNKLALHLFFIFVAYTMLSGLVYPFLFRGIPVMHGATQTPLSWSSSNFAQSAYLLAAAVLYLITISSSRDELQNAITWYVRGCAVAAVFAMYQLANAVGHVPYPDAILYSSPSYMIYRAYKINGMWRLNSTFTEASEMATFMMVGIGLLGWTLMTRPLRFWRVICFVLMLLSLLLTFSSLGYACLIFTVISGGILYCRYMFRRGGVSPARLALALVLLMATTALFTLSNDARQTINKVITSTLLEKGNSQSYRDRTATHAAALETLSGTYYMGAGWGSIRASGLAYIVLGNIGVVGLALLFALYASLFLPYFSRRWPRPLHGTNNLLGQSLFAITIMLVGLIIAGSEPVQPILWILFGIATAARPAKLTEYAEPIQMQEKFFAVQQM